MMKHWCLNLFSLLVFILFVSLGCWQLNRAHEKTRLLDQFKKQQQSLLFSLDPKVMRYDLRFQPIQLRGIFDNQFTFLLDNKVQHGQVGYQIYTPFKTANRIILVDRGFVAAPTHRQQFPDIPALTGEKTIRGILNFPPRFLSWGKMIDTKTPHMIRLEYLDLKQLSKETQQTYFPYVLQLDPLDRAAFQQEWQIVTLSPERHLGYALQWFAFAGTLLLLSVALNRRPS